MFMIIFYVFRGKESEFDSFLLTMPRFCYFVTHNQAMISKITKYELEEQICRTGNVNSRNICLQWL